MMEKSTATPLLLLLGLLLIAGTAGTETAYAQSDSEPTYLMIRADDLGMSHSVNMALKQLLDEGFPVSISVMFACPWYQEAVSILKQYDNASVGIHLTLNSEWQYYRWGPVAGQEAVPSLVDENGYFFHSASTLYENDPVPEEVEKELRYQIERALDSGLRIDYLDYHMGTAIGDPVFRKITENLAEEYGLGLWGYFSSHRFNALYRAQPEDKLDSLLAVSKRVKQGYSYIVTHIGFDNPELGAMKDMNSGSPLAEMSSHRQAELNAVTSDAFARALEEHGVRLVTFRDLIDAKGLESMKRREVEGY